MTLSETSRGSAGNVDAPSAAPAVGERRERSGAPGAVARLHAQARAGRFFGPLGVLLFLAAWEMVGRAIDNEVFLVPVTAVVADLAGWIASGEFFGHLRVSLTEFFLGLAFGGTIGLVLGVIMGLVPPVHRLLRPLALGMEAVPTIALTPLFVIWLGYGIQSKIVLLAVASVFPLLVNTSIGIKQADTAYLDAARSFGATTLQIIRHVRIPAALPFVFSGVQIAVTRLTVGIFVVELFGSTQGIGYTITAAATRFDTARLLSAITVLAALGIFMVGVVAFVAAKAAPWKRGKGEVAF